MAIKKIIISSTGLDLRNYRQAAIDLCLEAGLFPIAMENFEAMGLGATEGSKHKLDEADAYVGIFAHRYGYVEKGYRKSVTEIEFDYAGERKLDRMCFLADPEYPWPPEAWDYKNQKRLQNFKSRVGDEVIRALFTTVDDFKVKLQHALNKWKERKSENGVGKEVMDDGLASSPVPTSAPPLPTLLVGREQDLARLKARFGLAPNHAKQPLTIVRGWPGLGKTTLVNVLAYDREVVASFPDGVLWAAAGTSPSPLGELSAWLRALGVPDSGAKRPLKDVMDHLRALLRNRRALLIVDDVWDADSAAPFKVAGPECVTLFTTRFQDVARKLATTPADIYLLGQLDEEESLELLGRLAPTVVEQHPVESRQLVNDLEGLPLALRVAGRLLEAEVSMGWGVKDLLGELAAGKLLGETAPDDRLDPLTGTIPTVSILLRQSTDRLDEETLDRFAYLGAFAPKPATFDLEAMQAVWLVDDARPTARKLADRGLLEPIIGTGRFQMHAVLAMHAKSLLRE